MQRLLATSLLFFGLSAQAKAETITVAMVNNPDMVTVEHLAPFFTKKTGIHINWVMLPENRLRQRVTMDVATHSGTFDAVMIGPYEVPLWANAGWLAKIPDPGPAYDLNDIFQTVRDELSYKGSIYALPFYAESSMTYYRKDLFAKAGLTMPAHPTYSEIAQFADKITDKKHGIYGICLRGLPGFGENMAFISTLVNAFGGRWFDMNWTPQLTSPQWETAISYYVRLLRKDGPPNAASNGFTENLALFASGKCGIWVDSTVAAGTLFDPHSSRVAKVTGVAQAPEESTTAGSHWLWSWAFAIPVTSHKKQAAEKFIAWVTSKQYIRLVAQTHGWVGVPAGTRQSTYDNPAYEQAAPFAPLVEEAIKSADTAHPSALPVPYIGIQYVDIPIFTGIGTTVGQDMAAALAGRMSVKQALARAQRTTKLAVEAAGYLKK
ncbi:ABC transporter substrate-binding protein [Acidocella sp.]|uniref:ABC transporter substrate-binding protein n=1 Tax=Acidocella sp. TaxID=50710 RepID=UPI003CFFD92A